MNENRKFRVLKDFTLVLGTSIVVRRFKKGDIFDDNIMIDIDDLLSDNTIEEIIPDEKPISIESENPYGRQIYLAEAIHALTNHEVLIKDKYGYVWDYDKIDETFYTHDEVGDTIVITDKYTVKELLEFQFDVVPKPVEEVKEKWVRINNHKDLATAISKGKEIVAFNTHTKVTTIRTRVFTDRIIDKLFEQLEYNYIEIKYLEEN